MIEILREIDKDAEWSLSNGKLIKWISSLHPSVPSSEEISQINCKLQNLKRVSSSYNDMVADIYCEMKKTFNTESEASASAQFATWEAMIKRPANYTNTDLGLTSAEEVAAYAEAKLAQVDAYAVYRLNRIEQFRQEREQILNS